MKRQVTIAKEVSAKGVGVHHGVMAGVVLRPAKAGQGIVYRRMDEKGDFKLRPELVKASPLCTLLEHGGVTLSTVEHLNSALHGLGVDNVLVEIDGPEVPILDGSALPWVELIDVAGRTELESPRVWLKVEKPVVLDGEGRVLTAEPDAREALRVECTVDFPHVAIGRQHWQGVVDEAVYRREIAPARTFGFEKDIEALWAAGMAKGGSLENAVVFDKNGKVMNSEGLRFADEPVRHKVLDFVGDIFMAGRCVAGKFSLTAPGHIANNQLLRKIT